MQIIKTFALSKITLRISVLCIPSQITKSITSVLYKFLWNTNDKISRIRVTQSTDNGGLNVTDIRYFFDSLHASWISRFLEANLNVHSWAQIPKLLLGSLEVDGLYLRFNYDESVLFPKTEICTKFYKEALLCFNKAYGYVCDEELFERSISNQPVWGHKFITKLVRRQKSVLYVRNWMRSGVRKVCDLPFKNGILDENGMYIKLDCKKNIFREILLAKKALYPYRECIKNKNDELISGIIHLRSKDYYNIYKIRLACSANITTMTRYLDQYCNDEYVTRIAFVKKLLKEPEIKLKEFNFKILHGILFMDANLNGFTVCTNVIYISQLGLTLYI